MRFALSNIELVNFNFVDDEELPAKRRREIERVAARVQELQLADEIEMTNGGAYYSVDSSM